MSGDLFSIDEEFVQIPMQDGEVLYRSNFPLGLPVEEVKNFLIREVPWRAEKISVWGKTFDQPRLIAWYGDENLDYTYSGIHLNPMPWTALLLNIKMRVEAAVESTFNSVLLNYYRDNRDSMGFHSDDERELGHQPIIASLSLGEERTFILKHKADRTVKPLRLKLASGSLLLMKGDTQHKWKHGIEKETIPCGSRVNLTFRKILV